MLPVDSLVHMRDKYRVESREPVLTVKVTVHRFYSLGSAETIFRDLRHDLKGLPHKCVVLQMDNVQAWGLGPEIAMKCFAHEIMEQGGTFEVEGLQDYLLERFIDVSELRALLTKNKSRQRASL
jgi:hypothetical protein